MSAITATFDCRCGEQLEVEIEIDSHGYPAQTYGDPEGCYSGEGAEWHAEADVTCEECGTVYPATDLNERADLNEQVQERDAEPQEREYEPDDRF